jgi:hypothetical protein
MKIVFKKGDGCAVMTPTPQFLATLPSSMTPLEKVIFVADKDLPHGTKYEIVETVPEDRTFRMAWEYEPGPNERTAGVENAD